MVSDYRLSPVLIARLVGAALVLLAVLVFVATGVSVVLGLPALTLVAVVLVGLLGIAGSAYWLRRRVVVVHLDENGYRVRLVRGVGVASGPWTEVSEAVTSHLGTEPCVVLRLRDGRTTTIPMSALAADRDEFVRDLQAHLQHGHGLRPL